MCPKLEVTVEFRRSVLGVIHLLALGLHPDLGLSPGLPGHRTGVSAASSGESSLEGLGPGAVLSAP